MSAGPCQSAPQRASRLVDINAFRFGGNLVAEPSLERNGNLLLVPDFRFGCAGRPASFPNSGSGTPVRETPFRGPVGDETEFPGNAFPNGVRERGDIGSLPFYFEQNLGQADAAFDFVARGPGYTLGLNATEAIFRYRIQNPEFRIQNPWRASMRQHDVVMPRTSS